MCNKHGRLLLEFWSVRNDNFTLVAAVFTPQTPFEQDLDYVNQFFVRSEVEESSDTQVAATPRAKSNPFCSDSGFAELTTPLATSASQPTVTVRSSNPESNLSKNTCYISNVVRL